VHPLWIISSINTYECVQDAHARASQPIRLCQSDRGPHCFISIASLLTVLSAFFYCSTALSKEKGHAYGSFVWILMLLVWSLNYWLYYSLPANIYTSSSVTTRCVAIKQTPFFVTQCDPLWMVLFFSELNTGANTYKMKGWTKRERKCGINRISAHHNSSPHSLIGLMGSSKWYIGPCASIYTPTSQMKNSDLLVESHKLRCDPRIWLFRSWSALFSHRLDLLSF
jgi:hypothetical protein